MKHRNRISHWLGCWTNVYFSAGGSELCLIGRCQIDPVRRWRKRCVAAAPAISPRIRRPIKRKPPRTCTVTMDALSPKHVATFMGVPYQEPAA